jgi:DNA repair protein RecO (recombination protein O)
MIAKTRAVILKNTNYGENSVISKMYTREYGLRTYILQSIRKGKSAIRPSMIQPLSLVSLDIYEKPNSNINRIKELRNEPLLLNIQDSMSKKTIALFLIELLNQCITEEQCEEELFDLIEQEILSLENIEVGGLFPIVFMLKLAHHLGVEPQGIYSNNTPYLSVEDGVFVSEVGLNTSSQKASQLISNLMQSLDTSHIKVSSNVRKETLAELIKFYQYHITKNRKMKSVEILSELLA